VYTWRVCRSYYPHTFRCCWICVYLTRSCINLRLAPVLTTSRPILHLHYSHTHTFYLYVCVCVCMYRRYIICNTYACILYTYEKYLIYILYRVIHQTCSHPFIYLIIHLIEFRFWNVYTHLISTIFSFTLTPY